MAIWAMQEIANDKRKGTKVHGAGYLFRKLRRFPKELLADSKFVGKVLHLLSMTSGVPTVESFMDPNTKVPLVPPIISGKIVHDPDEETWERVRKWQQEQLALPPQQQEASGKSHQDDRNDDEEVVVVKDGETCHACYGAGRYYDDNGRERTCRKCNAWKRKRQQGNHQEADQPNVATAPSPAPAQESKPVPEPLHMIPGATLQDYYQVLGAHSKDPAVRAAAERKITERVNARSAAEAASAVAEPSPTHSACPLCRDSGQWYDRLTGKIHVCHHGEGGAFENQWLNRRTTKGNCRLCDDDCYSFDRRLNDQVPCDHDATSPDRCRLDDLTEEESAAYHARIEANQRKKMIEFQRSEERGLPVDQAAVVDGIQPPEIEAGSDDDEDGEELEHPEECECDKCLLVED